MRQLSLVFLLCATALHAQDAPREIFPADFTPSPCALETSCISFPDSSMASAAYQFLALQLIERIRKQILGFLNTFDQLVKLLHIASQDLKLLIGFMADAGSNILERPGQGSGSQEGQPGPDE